MTNQEIIDAIEAEIRATQELSKKVRLTNLSAPGALLKFNAYLSGLRFAKELIETRIEVTE